MSWHPGLRRPCSIDSEPLVVIPLRGPRDLRRSMFAAAAELGISVSRLGALLLQQAMEREDWRKRIQRGGITVCRR